MAARATAVVPTVRGGAPLAACLHALARQEEPVDVVVVADGPGADLRAAGEHGVAVVQRPERGGVAAAVNAGIAATRTECVVVLNDDVEAEPRFVAALLDALGDASSAAGVLLERADPTRIDSAGVVADRSAMGFDHLQGEPADVLAAAPPPLGPTGGAALYRLDALAAVGGFDERIPAYYEDLDVALRLAALGHRCAFAPDARALHHGSWTLGRASAEKYALSGFSRAYLLRRYGVVRHPALAAHALACETALCAGQLLIDGTAAGIRGRASGWRAAGGLPRHALPADGLLPALPWRALRRRARRRGLGQSTTTGEWPASKFPGSLDRVSRRPGVQADVMDALARAGVLRLDAIVAVVGAGSDRVLFDLTERVGAVVAIDAYRDGADARMINDVAACATPTWVWRRLLVRDGGAESTGLGDETADAVVITNADQATPEAVDEADRVLRPGGVLLVEGRAALTKQGELPGRRDQAASAKAPPSGRPVVGVRGDVVALAGFLPDRVVVVDAGCRWGFADTWHLHADVVTIIGFDPDAQECARLEEVYAAERPELDARFAAMALGSAEGEAQLERFAERAHDSLLPHDHAALDHLELGGEEPVLERVTVPVTTLDAWTAARGVERVDVLKLDVEGYELEVLRGAQARLADVRLVECEVRFNPIMAGGPLFGEVDAFLRDRGFVLWRLRDLAYYDLEGVEEAPDLIEMNTYGLGGDRRYVVGSGALTWGNAFWVRADMVDRAARTGWERRLRDATIANAMRLHDLTLHALARLLEERPPAGLAAAAAAVLAKRS